MTVANGATKGKQITNLALASRVSRHAELAWIRLRRARLDMESADIDSLPAELRFDTSQRQSYSQSPDQSTIDVFLEYRLDISNGRVREALVEAEYQLRYILPEEHRGFSNGELRWFAELNGTLNSWPYWRELAQTVLGRAGMGSLTLPLWRPAAIQVDEAGSPQRAVEEG